MPELEGKRLVAILPEEQPIRAADTYQIDLNAPDCEMRVVLEDSATGKKMAHVMSSEEAYSFAQKILRGYDQLEGL